MGISEMNKRIIVCAVAALAVFLIEIATGQEEEMLTNADVVALSKAGLPASAIAAKIKVTNTDFDTSVEQLVALSKAGVDSAIIEVMVNAGKSAGTQEAHEDAQVIAPPAPPAPPQVQLTQTGTAVRLVWEAVPDADHYTALSD